MSVSCAAAPSTRAMRKRADARRWPSRRSPCESISARARRGRVSGPRISRTSTCASMPNTAASGTVHVAAGLLLQDGRVFITRRPTNTHQGGKWEFPGGKLLSGETALAALKRELHEELGVEVEEAVPYMQVRHRYLDKEVLLDVWRVTAYRGAPHGREGQGARWAAPSDLVAPGFPPAPLPG